MGGGIEGPFVDSERDPTKTAYKIMVITMLLMLVGAAISTVHFGGKMLTERELENEEKAIADEDYKLGSELGTLRLQAKMKHGRLPDFEA